MWCSGIDGEIIRGLLNHDGAAPHSMSHQDGDIRPDQTRHGMEKGSPGYRLCRPEARQRGLAPGSAGVSDWALGLPLLFLSQLLCVLCVALVASKSQAPGGLQLSSKAYSLG